MTGSDPEVKVVNLMQALAEAVDAAKEQRRTERVTGSDRPATCGARAPIVKFDEGPNHCDREPGHKGQHSCIPVDLPYYLKHDGYRRNWKDGAS